MNQVFRVLEAKAIVTCSKCYGKPSELLELEDDII